MTAAFYGLCLALMLVMRFAPATPIGTSLNHHLVAEPLARLSTLERHHLVFLAIVLAMSLVAGEALAIYGTFEWAVVSMFDVSVYLDAIAVTVVAGAAARVRGTLQFVRARLAVPRGPRRAARQRRTRPERKPQAKTANDDDHAGLPLVA